MASRLFFGVALVALSNLCLVQSEEPSPWVVPSSNQWDGIDGPWSSFTVGIGSRTLRCLPGISLDVVVLPVESPSCNKNSTNSCAYRTTFDRSLSGSWKAAVNDTEWDWTIKPQLNKTMLASTVSGTDDILLNEAQDYYHVRSTIETSSLDFFVGIFGLWNSSRAGGRSEALLAQLAKQAIPSVSFSYTAGSIRKNTKGSLIFGGYDTSRIKTGTTMQGRLSNAFANLVDINVEAIYVNSTWSASWTSPAFQSAQFHIEPAIPHIWLPLEACTMFEKAFSLTWNADLGLYLVNDTTHAQLLQENPSISFLLGSRSGVPSKMITLSYASFDLQLSSPLVEKNTSYFPIRRASSPSQYVLGRAFLQETYLTVDYESGTFNLSVAEEYTAQGGTILPILRKTAPVAPSGNNTQVKVQSTLSGGAYAGIGIGIAVFVILVAGLIFFCWRQRSRKAHNIGAIRTPDEAELQAEDKEVPISVVTGHMELPDKEVVELLGREPGELETISMQIRELETEERNHEVNAVRLPIELSKALPPRVRNSW